MKLSVVVPVYNVEKYLPRCLDSLLRQGMEAEEYEVICVNDGSPDHSAAILAEYEAKHPDIFKVVTQENRGLGGARNTGTAQAQGEYVTYLDSDDYVIDNAYSYLLEHFCQDRPDVLCYGHHRIYTDGKALQDPNAKPDGDIVFDGDGVDAFNRWPLSFVWSKLYRRGYLEKYHIESEIVICQDEIFNFDVFKYHPHTRIVSSSVCRYENGNPSSIQTISKKEIVLVQLNDLIYNLGLMRKYLESGNKDLLPAANRTIDNFINVYYHKLLRSERLTKDEWTRNGRLMKGYSISPERRKEYTHFLEKLMLWMSEWAATSYVGYVLIYFIRHTLFQYIYYPLFIARRRQRKIE